MQSTKCVLLKLTGNLFLPEHRTALHSIISQLGKIRHSRRLGIVVGGGNIFRGHENSTDYGISTTAGHTVGMLATMINGVFLQDLFERAAIPSVIVTGMPCPQVGELATHQAFVQAHNNGSIIIFAGGTGLPYVTTDTNAMIRALQLDAYEVWKATSVDGIYTEDPKKSTTATKLPVVSYQTAREQKLGFIDPVACTLAEQHTIPVRVFSAFEENVLIRIANNESIGSLLT